MKAMSTERRALLAFALSMVLFLAYDALYLAPKMKRERERREAAALLSAQDVAGRPRAADTLRAGAEPPALTTPAAHEIAPSLAADIDSLPDRPQKTIIVSSPLYEFVLSSRGAEMTSARLLRYETQGKPVELLAAGDSWSGHRMLSASLKSETTTLPLDDIVFEVTAGGGELADGARVVVSGDTPVQVLFRAQTAGGAIERSYRFYGDRYEFEAELRASDSILPGAQGVSWSFGPGLTATEANVPDDQSAFRASILLGEEHHRKQPGNFGREHIERFSGTLNWASVQTKYFMAALYPAEPTRADIEVSGIKHSHQISQSVSLPVKTAASEVAQSVRVFVGPLDYRLLEGIGIGLERNVEFGWKFIRPVSSAVLWLMKTLYRVIPNYGLVVIIISILTKVLFYRLTHKSFKSMKEMQDLQPRLQALKEKYGDDRRRLSEETMRLYKEAGVNPLGGCLPMLLQMPVFIALFNVFRFTIELRGAPFVGWINDLSQQDVLFRLPISLPFIGDAFSLLPLLMGAAMWAQSKLGQSPTGQTSTAIPPGFNTLLPIVFTVLFYKMPSGLVIYWIINTVMSVAQQYYIVKSHPTSPAAAVVVETPKKRGRARARRG
jgi:YidC/Oxa1 family membrane protein insertase